MTQLLPHQQPSRLLCFMCKRWLVISSDPKRMEFRCFKTILEVLQLYRQYKRVLNLLFMSRETSRCLSSLIHMSDFLLGSNQILQAQHSFSSRNTQWQRQLGLNVKLLIVIILRQDRKMEDQILHAFTDCTALQFRTSYICYLRWFLGN